VRDELASALTGQAVADVELLTSELVSNAIQHARTDGDGTIRLDIGLTPEAIHVCVVDGGTGFDPIQILQDPHPDEGGWGLFLVEELSDRWGIDDQPHGVWFEFDR
jgi:anti-sigma regulatory factor (Ser/Thr protein kinase)